MLNLQRHNKEIYKQKNVQETEQIAQQQAIVNFETVIDKKQN